MELLNDKELKVKIYIDLENIKNAWIFVKHLTKKQKAIIITSNIANIHLEVPMHEIQKLNAKRMKAIIVDRNKYRSDGVCDVRLLSELMDNINKADIHIIISKDNGFKAFTDFNKKCNQKDKTIYQISTEQELCTILKEVNAHNANVKRVETPINPMKFDDDNEENIRKHPYRYIPTVTDEKTI